MGICASKKAVEAFDPEEEEEEEEAQELSLREGNIAPFYTTFSTDSYLSLTESSTSENWDDPGMFSFMQSQVNQDVATDMSVFENLFDEENALPLQNEGYKIIRVLGRGASAQVYEMEKEGIRYAVKVCIISDLTVNFLNPETHQPKEEAAILRNFNHPYVIKIFDIIENKICVYIIMELLSGGNILSISDIKQKKIAFAQICAALEYIHSLNFAHRDIKCENTLMDENNVIKLCDFGISEYIGNPKELTPHKMKGTPAYCAPEVFSSDPYDLKVADIWSLGVLLYVLFFGKIPFTGKNIFELEKTIKSVEPEYPESADPDLVDLLKGILTKNAKHRYTIQQIWNSEWMKGLEKEVKNKAAFIPAGIPINTFTRKNSIRYASNLVSQ